MVPMDDHEPSSQAAFRRQLAALLPRLGRFALALTRNRAEAEDLTQTACERALARARQWQPGTRLDSWVFRIMQNLWLNELRARRVRQGHAEQAAPEGEGATPANAADARLALDQVSAAMLRLPEELRTVLVLVCVEGFTYREAAEIAAIPIGTVMSRLARARLTLMAMIGEEGAPGTKVVRMVSK